jgi:putative colanic acid biosynthesis acetyltransferase WcaF
MTSPTPIASVNPSPKPAWRRMLRRIAPLRKCYRWGVDVWADLRLYLLTIVGYVPSHAIRNFWYRCAGVRLAKSSSLHWRARFFCPEGLVIGEHCTLGNDGFYDARDGITIGNCVNIAAEVRIYTREHDIDDPDFAEIGGPVVIEDYVYIGTRVTILPGVKIGKGAVVASGAVVAKDVPPFMLVGGVPARLIRERSHDLRYKLGYAKRFQ